MNQSSCSLANSSKFLNISIGSPHNGANIRIRKRPIQTLKPSEITRSHEKTRSQISITLSNLMSSQLYEFEDTPDAFQIQFPNTTSTRVVSMASLMQSPNDTELSTITRNENGEAKPLNSDMIEEIKEYGTFRFPSQQYPPLQHVWKITAWAQRGARFIKRNLQKRICTGLSHIYLSLCGCFCGDGTVPIQIGIKLLSAAIRAIFNALVGIPQYGIKTSSYDMNDLFRSELSAFLIQKAIIEEEKMDMQLFTNKTLGESLQEITTLIRDEENYGESSYIRRHEEFIETENILSDYDSSVSVSIPSLEERFVQLEREHQLNHLEKIPALLNGGPETVKLAKMARKTDFIRKDILGELQPKIERKKIEVEETINQKHPILSTIKSWRKREVNRRMKKLKISEGGDLCLKILNSTRNQDLVINYDTSAIARELQNQVVDKLENLGEDFHQESKLERWRNEFLHDHWPIIENNVMEDRQAMIEIEHYRQSRNGERGCASKTKSNFFGWRAVAGLKWMYYFCLNGCLSLSNNLWGSQLGIQALFRISKFWHLGQQKPTMISNLRELWASVKRRRTEFESEEEEGLLSKDIARPVQYIINYFIRGVLSSIIQIFMHIILSSINIVVSGILLISFPVISLVTYSIGIVFNLTIFDPFVGNVKYNSFEIYNVDYYDSSLLAAVRETFSLFHQSSQDWRVYKQKSKFDLRNLSYFILPTSLIYIISGLFLLLGSPTFALLFHPILSFLNLTYGIISFFIRSSCDWFFRILFKIFGRWPSSDSWLATRIEGPGISSTYFYLLETPVISKCIVAYLEKMELAYFRERVEDEIQQPEREFNLFCSDTMRHITGSYRKDSLGMVNELAKQSPIGTRLRARSLQIQLEIKKKFEQKEDILDKLLLMPIDSDRIRCKDNFSHLLDVSQKKTQLFYENRLKPLGEEYVIKLWKTAGCSKNDFRNLTVFILKTIFGEHISEDMKESDEKGFEITIADDQLIQLNCGVISNIGLSFQFLNMQHIPEDEPG